MRRERSDATSPTAALTKNMQKITFLVGCCVCMHFLFCLCRIWGTQQLRIFPNAPTHLLILLHRIQILWWFQAALSIKKRDIRRKRSNSTSPTEALTKSLRKITFARVCCVCLHVLVCFCRTWGIQQSRHFPHVPKHFLIHLDRSLMLHWF